MGKFTTLREEFESETGAHPFADQQYIKWLEGMVEKLKQVKNCSTSDDVRRSEKLPNMTLEKAIEKAKPNMDKIKDVDKYLDDIR